MRSFHTLTAVVCLTAGILGAQVPKAIMVRGEIANFPSNGDTFSVELRPVTHTGSTIRELAANDGSFEFHNVEPGTYEASIVTIRGTSLRREIVHLDAFANRFTIQMPKAAPSATAGGRPVNIKRLAFKPSKEAKKMYRKAQTEVENKRFAEGVEYFKRATELEPEWAEAYNNLGVQYYRLMRIPEAHAAMKRAVEIDPDSPEMSANYAIVLIPMGRAAESEALIRRVMLRNGETPKGQFVLGMALAAQGVKKEEARALLTGVADQFPGAKTFLSKLR